MAPVCPVPSGAANVSLPCDDDDSEQLGFRLCRGLVVKGPQV